MILLDNANNYIKDVLEPHRDYSQCSLSVIGLLASNIRSLVNLHKSQKDTILRLETLLSIMLDAYLRCCDQEIYIPGYLEKSSKFR